MGKIIAAYTKFSKDKAKNPWGLYNVPYDRPIVEFVDKLMEMSMGNGLHTQIENTRDWEILDFIMRGWEILYPKHSAEFLKWMKEWRRQSTHLGVSKEKGGAMVQHKFNVPEKVDNLMKAVFPRQRWDKTFVNKFAKRYGQFAGSDKL